MVAPSEMMSAVKVNGISDYYQGKIDQLEITVREKTENLRRLQAQRNELNSKGILLFLRCSFLDFFFSFKQMLCIC